MTLKDYSLTQAKPKPAADILDGLDEAELLALRHKIDLRLNIEISNLNLTEELGLQYRQGQALLQSVQNDKDVQANQKAQVFNSVSAMLEKIIKQQDIVYSAERLKRFEVAILRVLEKLPPESKQVYFDLYSEYLGDKGV